MTGASGTIYREDAYQALMTNPALTQDGNAVRRALDEANANLVVAASMDGDDDAISQLQDRVAWLSGLNPAPLGALATIKAKWAALPRSVKIGVAIAAGLGLVKLTRRRRRG